MADLQVKNFKHPVVQPLNFQKSLMDYADVAHGNSLQMREREVKALGDLSWCSFMSCGSHPSPWKSSTHGKT